MGRKGIFDQNVRSCQKALSAESVDIWQKTAAKDGSEVDREAVTRKGLAVAVALDPEDPKVPIGAEPNRTTYARIVARKATGQRTADNPRRTLRGKADTVDGADAKGRSAASRKS